MSEKLRLNDSELTPSLGSEAEANIVVVNAIREVLAAFPDMTERDRDLLEHIANQDSDPVAKVISLRQMSDPHHGALNISELFPEYVNQVFLTLKQKFNKDELERFRFFASDLLRDIK